MYLSLKDHLLFSKILRFSCLSPTEYHILAMIHNIFLKILDINFNLVSFDSIRLYLQINIKNLYFSLNNILYFTKDKDVIEGDSYVAM